MGRFVRRAAPRFGLSVMMLCIALLAGQALVNRAQPAAASAAAHSASVRFSSLLSTSATPTPRATTTPRASGTAKSAQPASESQSFDLRSVLPEAIALLLALLLGFGLMLYPVVRRSARDERRSRLAYPLEMIPPEKLEAQLSQVAPERKEPLSREQMRELKEAAQARAASPSSTASLASMRLVDGVPVSLPMPQEDPAPQLPAPRSTEREPIAGRGA